MFKILACGVVLLVGFYLAIRAYLIYNYKKYFINRAIKEKGRKDGN